MPILLRFARWLVQKLAVAALIVSLALAAYGLALFLRENIDVERQRAEQTQRLAAQRAELQEKAVEIERRIASYQQELAAQRARVAQAQKVLAGLKALEGWWDRLFGDSTQRTMNEERMRRVEQLQADSNRTIAELGRSIVEAGAEKDGVDTALQRVERDLQRLEASPSTAAHYFRRAWDSAKWYVAAALVGYFFGPTLWSALMYYGFAALASRGRPIRLAEEMPALPAVGPSRVSVEATLRRGEVLRIKEKFLQASDEGVRKSTRFVLDWRIPLTSLACGLVELVELRPEADSDYHVTLSNADDPHLELATVEIPAGGSLVLRPSFLAGVIQRADETLRIRRRWQLFRWQAWITGQLRFFEFHGPCRLILAGSRGVRAEVLAEREGVAMPARRTNQDATIGFTPNLVYRPVRAETFWSYYRGMNPLFDDLFAGRGLFVLQETSTPGAAAKAGKFWSSVWSGLLKVFGL